MTIELHGCAPTPLAHYLKALAILRIVAEQADPSVRAHWNGDTFALTTTLSREDLVQFFLHDYMPAPVVAPWNGGSGFNPKDNKTAINAIRAGSSPRFSSYRNTIEAATDLRADLGIDEKVSSDQKEELLVACRSVLPDSAVQWLDAAIILTSDGPKYPPLLGTGGNDGRLDFTNNYMQRLCDLIDPESGEPSLVAESWLRTALFGTSTDGLGNNVMGQFHPSAARVNAWDFVLMIEGAIVFAGAAVRKLESSAPGTLSYPFSVRQSGIGYGTSTQDDENNSRAEIWVPLWTSAASFAELQTLMSEGRARVAGRPVKNGVDFARAIATLGIDRGVDSFQRYGFQVRNGLAYYATPLGRFEVRKQPQVDLLNPIDRWLDRFIGRAKSAQAPSSVARAARNLEAAILALTQRSGRRQLQAVLASLGACEAAMATSFGWTTDPRARTRPVPPLEPQWLTRCDDGTVEYRLAASLASLSTKYMLGGKSRLMPLRAHLTPIDAWEKDGHLRAKWVEQLTRDLVWSGASLQDNLSAVLQRRLLLATQSGHGHFVARAKVFASLSDIAAFVEGRTDDARLEELLRGLLLLDWPAVERQSLQAPSSEKLSPDASYGVLKLCFAGRAIGDIEIPVTPAIVTNAAAGDRYAMTLALRRLRASGLAPAVDALWVDDAKLRRLAAALLFPVSRRDVEALCRSVLRTEDAPTDNHPNEPEQPQA